MEECSHVTGAVNFQYYQYLCEKYARKDIIMKLMDILTSNTHSKYGDMDVVNDVIDEFFPAWCGTLFTKEGAEEFTDALGLDAEIINCGTPKYPEYRILVHVDGPHWRDCRSQAKSLFECMAGYCDDTDYKRWFIDYDEYHLTSTELLTNVQKSMVSIWENHTNGEAIVLQNGEEEVYILRTFEKDQEYPTLAELLEDVMYTIGQWVAQGV